MSSTTPSAPLPSTRVLRTALVWGGIVTAGLAVAGAVVGFVVAGAPGLASALAGVVLAAVFLAVTAGSILFANRWHGDPVYVSVFFGIVMGGWILKLVLFLVVLAVMRAQPWVVGPLFFSGVVASVLAALAVDAVVLLRLRVPAVSDASLPTVVQDR